MVKRIVLFLIFLLAFGFSDSFGDILTVKGAQHADDGQQYTGEYNDVNITYPYVELRIDLVRWGGAYRFPNLTVPQGATINSALIRFACFSMPYNVPVCSVACEDVDSATILTTANYNISNRWNNNARTTATVLWIDTLWLSGCSWSIFDTTWELKAMVQEIVDRPGWKSGNAIMFIFKLTSSGGLNSYCETYAWQNTTSPPDPQLYVNYTPAEEDTFALLRIKDDWRFIPSFVMDWRFQDSVSVAGVNYMSRRRQAIQDILNRRD